MTLNELLDWNNYFQRLFSTTYQTFFERESIPWPSVQKSGNIIIIIIKSVSHHCCATRWLYEYFMRIALRIMKISMKWEEDECLIRIVGQSNREFDLNDQAISFKQSELMRNDNNLPTSHDSLPYLSKSGNPLIEFWNRQPFCNFKMNKIQFWIFRPWLITSIHLQR